MNIFFSSLIKACTASASHVISTAHIHDLRFGRDYIVIICLILLLGKSKCHI